VLGPAVPALVDASQSARASLAGFAVARAWRNAPRPVEADDLLIGMSELSGDATFKNIDIGQDASTLSKDGAATHGAVGSFGQQADSVTIDGLHQIAYSTSASTFKLTGMSLKLLVGTGKECF
jgi:hypothetical protein